MAQSLANLQKEAILQKSQNGDLQAKIQMLENSQMHDKQKVNKNK